MIDSHIVFWLGGKFIPSGGISPRYFKIEKWYMYSFILDPESPVIFERSFLLVESTNTMFVCNTEIKKYAEIVTTLLKALWLLYACNVIYYLLHVYIFCRTRRLKITLSRPREGRSSYIAKTKSKSNLL